MKVKILAQLKAKFPGVPNNLLDRVASVLEKTVTKEEDIETAVNNSAGLVQEFSAFHQSEADRRVTEAVQKRENELKAEFEKKKDPVKTDQKHEEVPVWAKTMIETNKALAEKVMAFENANNQKSLSEKLISHLGEKKIPAKFFSKAIEGRTFKDEEEMNTFAAGIETNYSEYQQELINSGFMQQPTPAMGGQNKEGVSAAVQNFVNEIKAEQEGKASTSPLGGKKI
jgi:hypothetical protein